MRRFNLVIYIFTSIIFMPTEQSVAGPEDQSLVAQLHVQLQQQQEEIRFMRGEIDELRNQLKSQGREQVNSMAMSNTHAAVKPFAPNTSPMQMTLPGKPQVTGSQATYSQAVDLLNQRRYAEAEVVLNQFIASYPNDPLLVNAYYWLAETYYIRGDYQHAALKFGEAYEAYLRHKNSSYAEGAADKAPEIMVKLALSLSNIGKHNDAKIILSELEKEFKTIPGNLNQQIALLRREIARNTT